MDDNKKQEDSLERILREQRRAEIGDEPRKRYVSMRVIYDFTMAILILGVGLFAMFGSFTKIDFFANIEPLMRYMFGGLCLLYGGFRLYRAIKHDY